MSGIEILSRSALISCIVIFIHATMWQGMIFAPIGRLFSRLPLFIRKPLFECTVCMAPWWGSLIYLAIWQGGVADVAICVAVSAGINVLLSSKVDDASFYVISKDIEDGRKR